MWFRIEDEYINLELVEHIKFTMGTDDKYTLYYIQIDDWEFTFRNKKVFLKYKIQLEHYLNG